MNIENKPKYSIEEILEVFKTMKFNNFYYDNSKIFIEQILDPVIFHFNPPITEINSTYYLNKSNLNKRTSKFSSKPKKNLSNLKNSLNQNNNDQEKPILWIYKDHCDHVIGPFTTEKMREWYLKKYFDKNLQIKIFNTQNNFLTIEEYFFDIEPFIENLDKKKINLLDNNKKLFSLNLNENEEEEIKIQLKLK